MYIASYEVTSLLLGARCGSSIHFEIITYYSSPVSTWLAWGSRTVMESAVGSGGGVTVLGCVGNVAGTIKIWITLIAINV